MPEIPSSTEPKADHPQSIGRYQILRRLGEGGMGSVFLARDTILHREVALKLPLTGTENDPEVRERFLREARSAATLDHPYICRVHDADFVDGRLYMAMAYIEGKSLADMVRAEGIPPRQVVALVGKLAIAMNEAHLKGVVHRDLKPRNVMIRTVGTKKEPVIVDFGLARLETLEDLRVTKTGQILGTPAYMSPEQLRGNPDEIGPACDIYALGVILYELLTGQMPFSGPYPVIIAQILTQPPSPPSIHRRGLDPTLDAICLKAMAKDVPARYATMMELATTLTEYLRATPTVSISNRPVAPIARPIEGESIATGADTLVGQLLGTEVARDGANIPTFDLSPVEKIQKSEAVKDSGQTDEDTSRRTSGRRKLWRNVAIATALLSFLILGGIFLVDQFKAGQPTEQLAMSGPPESGRVESRLERGMAGPLSLKVPGLGSDSKPPDEMGTGGGAVPPDSIVGTGIGGSGGENDSPPMSGSRMPGSGRGNNSPPIGGPGMTGSDSNKSKPFPLPGSGESDTETTPSNGEENQPAFPGRMGMQGRPVGNPKPVKNSIGMSLVLIPSGEFLMGGKNGPGVKQPSVNNATPQHRVRISKPFYLGMYEVTQQEYSEIMRIGPSSHKGPGNLPVDSVSWFDAVEFCNKLSIKEKLKPYYLSRGEQFRIAGGKGYRLPTEAEWEYACRSASDDNFVHGNQPAGINAYAWLAGNSGKTSHPVGQKQANAFGLYDIIGNVGEWCWDWHATYTDNGDITIDPKGPETGSNRIVRGSAFSWTDPTVHSNFHRSTGVPPGTRDYRQGFRVAKDSP